MTGIPECAVHTLAIAGFEPESSFSSDADPANGDLIGPSVQFTKLPCKNSSHRTGTTVPPGRWDGGSCLTFGFGNCCGHPNWLGDRFVWWPHGRVWGRTVGPVSSRLPRCWDTLPEWFAALRSMAQQLSPKNDVLLCAASTSIARFVQRAAVQAAIPLLMLHEPRTTSVARWLRGLAVDSRSASSGPISEAFVSPPMRAEALIPQTVRDIPLRDRLVVALSKRLFVLRLRSGGFSERLVRARLLERPQDSVTVATGAQLVLKNAADQLAALGATVWHPTVRDIKFPAALTETSRAVAPKGPTRPQSAIKRTAIVSDPPLEPWSYLTHCTRRPRGAWPDQTEESFIDELIRRTGDVDRSPLAALRRIIGQQKIMACHRSSKSSSSTVCFTEVPLRDLRSLRVFRPHRGRWDFEPYGIAIDRSWLQCRGARAVRYGDEELRGSLSDGEKAFFQREASVTSSGRRIEWRLEREWRHLGDVDLSDLSATEGLVFVPTAHEARQLVPISRWPIVIVESANGQS